MTGDSRLAEGVDSNGDVEDVVAVPLGIGTTSFLFEVAGVGGIQLDTILTGVAGGDDEHVQTDGPHKQIALLRVDILAILFSSFSFNFLPILKHRSRNLNLVGAFHVTNVM